jgi:(p)ppGpp synthase/HD superfamily hydrolase
MKVWNPDKYLKALNYASYYHEKQLVPGSSTPYIIHPVNTAMEIMTALASGEKADDPDLSIQCALLHDTLEDTSATFEDLEKNFGDKVALGVLALTKKDGFKSKPDKMDDSLKRIKLRGKEIWMVKLADRISNMKKPPDHWSYEKRILYKEESEKILNELKSSSRYLSKRLELKIENYLKYCS